MATVPSDHTTSQGDVQWNSIGPQTTLLMPLNGSMGSVLAFRELAG